VTWKVLSKDSHLVSGELNFAYASKIAILKDISIPYIEITQKTLKILTWLFFLLLLALVLIGRKNRLTSITSIVVSLLSLAQVGIIVSEIKLPLIKTINLIPETKTLLLFALTPIIYLLIKKPYLPLIAIFSLAGLFTGHHKTVDGKLGDLTTLSHITHLAAVAAWVSAVAAILLSKDPAQMKKSSKISIISVAVLIPVGITQSIILARPFENNHWVKVMLVKVALLTVTLFLGLLNNLSLKKTGSVNKKIVKDA
jgi:putative copper export protein